MASAIRPLFIAYILFCELWINVQCTDSIRQQQLIQRKTKDANDLPMLRHHHGDHSASARGLHDHYDAEKESKSDAMYWDDWYETQIDPRIPRSFPQEDKLMTRQRGFHTINTTAGALHVNNWELWAQHYWYEYKPEGMECPDTPVGIAAATDWTLTIPCLFGDISQKPRTIFVNTLMLPHFAESTLRFMPHDVRFVLVSGGHDMTIPESRLDARYGLLRGDYWDTILEDERVVHWFAENRDKEHPKVSSLPTGFIDWTYNGVDDIRSAMEEGVVIKPLKERNLTVLSSDRARHGSSQWNDRNFMIERCRNASSFCVMPEGGKHRDKDGGYPHTEFLEFLTSHAFVLCVHGGGIDPSPKAFESILAGTIPILKRSIIHDAYSHYPVVWLDEWSDLFEAKEPLKLLMKWRDALAPYYIEGSELRRQTIRKLKTSWWMNQFLKKLSNTTTVENELEETYERISEGTASSHRSENGARHHTRDKRRRQRRSLRGVDFGHT